jgi:tetratricopeptide (TPR) repeat protein
LAIAILVLAAIAPISGRAQDDTSTSNPQTLFFKANAHYSDGAYQAAVDEYRRLLAAGLESGNLHFNLGNAYFKLGDIGRAIASYERAARLIPGDPDLAANLAYAQTQTGAAPCTVPMWRRVVFPLRGRMPSATLGWLASFFVALACAALIVHRLLPAQPRSAQYAAAGLGLLAAIAGGSLADQLLALEWRRHAVVVGIQDAAARFEPAEDGTVHFALPEGTRVEIADEREGWVQVSRCDGRRGWLPASNLEGL